MAPSDQHRGGVWQAVVAVLRDPKFLCRKVGENQDALCLAIADLTGEIDRIKGALVDLGRQMARAMQAFLEHDLSELGDAFRAKLVEIQDRMAELKREQARLEIKQAAYASDGSRQDAVQQYCRLVLRGIDRLDVEGRHHLLALLIDEIRVDGRQLEIRGILPAGPMVANGPQRADDRTARLWKDDARQTIRGHPSTAHVSGGHPNHSSATASPGFYRRA
jgi:hypothetical protein